MPTTIYTLSNPHTSEVRYVGKTMQGLARRLAGHFYAGRRRKKNTHTAYWILSLGCSPIITALAVVEDKMAAETERGVIASFRASGYRLTNHTEGGEGLAGYKFTEEQRARLSAAHIGLPGHPHSAESKAKLSRAHKGKRLSPEHRAKLSIAHKGQVVTEAHREKLRKAMQGNTHGVGYKPSLERIAALAISMKGNQHAKGSKGPLGYRHSSESKARMSASRTGRVFSAEHRAHISAAGMGRVVSAETRAKIGAANRARWERYRNGEIR